MILLPLLLAAHGADRTFTLAAAVERARDSAASALAAQQRVADDSLARREVFGHLLPKVQLEASQLSQSANIATFGIPMHGVANYVPFYSIQDVRAKVSVPLVNAPLWNRLREARAGGRAHGEEFLAARSVAALQGALAWTEAARAKALVKDREEGLALARTLRALTEEQKSAGAATRLDQVRAQAQEIQADKALSQAKLALEKAQLQLARLLALPRGEQALVSGELAMGPESGEGIASREEPAAVRAARAGREVAAEGVRTARADWMPTVAAFGDYGFTGTHLEKDGEWTGKVGIQASWDVFEGGSRKAKEDRARVKERLAGIQERDARLTARQDEEEALAAVRESAVQLRQAMEGSALADTELVLAQEKFKAGASGNAEVVQAQGSRTQAHAAWIEAAGAHRAALLKLRYARGNWEGLGEP